MIILLSINSPYISSTCDKYKCIDVNMRNCTKQHARRGQTEKDEFSHLLSKHNAYKF